MKCFTMEVDSLWATVIRSNIEIPLRPQEEIIAEIAALGLNQALVPIRRYVIGQSISWIKLSDQGIRCRPKRKKIDDWKITFRQTLEMIVTELLRFGDDWPIDSLSTTNGKEESLPAILIQEQYPYVDRYLGRVTALRSRVAWNI